MTINYDNYEAYFLDFIEGRLDLSKLEELKAFLEINPDLKENLETIELLYITPDLTVYTDKQSLKKLNFEETEITETSINDFCIAYNERLLNDIQTKKLLEYISRYPNHHKIFNLYQKTYLNPQAEIKFEFKNQLYHKNRRTIIFVPYIRWASVAACLGLLFAGYQIYLNKNFINTDTNSEKIITYNKKNNTLPAIIPVKTIKHQTESKHPKTERTRKIKTITPSFKEQRIKEEEVTHNDSNTIYAKNEIITEPKNDSATTIIAQKTDSYNEKKLSENIRPLANTSNNQKSTSAEDSSKNKSPIYQLANITLKQFNKLTGSNIKLTKKKKKDTNHISFSFKSGIFEYYHSKSN
ncbi:MAG: hypothetical protein Q8928_01675 [Bacteroidota bacterium]|nr:hypothetical protein [Bacteroidota bacterium]